MPVICYINQARYHGHPNLDKDIKTCEDIDECTTKRPCDVNGLCMNTQEKLLCEWVRIKMNISDPLKLIAF